MKGPPLLMGQRALWVTAKEGIFLSAKRVQIQHGALLVTQLETQPDKNLTLFGKTRALVWF